MPALRYYAEAAESALLHFSPSQTIELAERPCRFSRRRGGDARTNLEMTLATLQGTAAVQDSAPARSKRNAHSSAQ